MATKEALRQAWIQDAWSQLDRDFRDGKFAPNNEFDIQAHLYYCLVNLRQRYETDAHVRVHVEWGGHRSQGGAVDLVLTNDTSNQPYVLAEIKETRGDWSRGTKSDLWNRKLKRDVEKLESLSRNQGATIPSLYMLLFCRGAKRSGLGINSLQVCTELGSELKERGVTFLYGPRPEGERFA